MSFSLVIVNTYMVFVALSITGVEVMPTSGLIPSPSVEVTDGPKFTNQSGDVVFPSASKAYTLLCWVAMKTTLCTSPLMVTFGRYSGCAYTWPSTVYENSFPNCDDCTLPGLSMVS